LEDAVQPLAGTLARATENTIDRWGYISEKEFGKLATDFLEAVLLEDLIGNNKVQPRRIRRWVHRLCLLLVEEELEKATSTIEANMIGDVADTNLDGLLKDSKETLYYVVSWALFKEESCICLSAAERERELHAA
jgi:hypothetical protein